MASSLFIFWGFGNPYGKQPEGRDSVRPSRARRWQRRSRLELQPPSSKVQGGKVVRRRRSSSKAEFRRQRRPAGGAAALCGCAREPRGRARRPDRRSAGGQSASVLRAFACPFPLRWWLAWGLGGQSLLCCRPAVLPRFSDLCFFFVIVELLNLF